MTNSQVIVDFLLNRKNNLNSKNKMKESNILNKILKCSDPDNQNSMLQQNNEDSKKNDLSNIGNNRSLVTNADKINKMLDIAELKYFSDERILKYSNGYENNNYVILSIIHDKFELFKYLITERNLDLKFKNSNGWTILHFIIYHKRIGTDKIIVVSFCKLLFLFIYDLK